MRLFETVKNKIIAKAYQEQSRKHDSIFFIDFDFDKNVYQCMVQNKIVATDRTQNGIINKLKALYGLSENEGTFFFDDIESL